MRVIVQRSKYSKVSVGGKLINEIPHGMVLLVGFTYGDTMDDIDYMVKKIVNLRIFDDEEGVMNKSLLDVGGEILSISQFTLYANTKKGNRPSYVEALKREEADGLYKQFNEKLNAFVPTYSGVFGAEMQVAITNDGPITIFLDSKDK